jgi:hypothetical protein
VPLSRKNIKEVLPLGVLIKVNGDGRQMNIIKLGGGHHICDKCGQVIFGSKIHTCKYAKLDYWKKRCELAEEVINSAKLVENNYNTFCFFTFTKEHLEWQAFINKVKS